METIRSFSSAAIGWMLHPFSGHPAMLSLVPLSIGIGIAMLWVFRRTSDQDAMRRTKARLSAHLLEMRLFADEPLLVWKAQRGLVAANLRYIGMVLVPALVMLLPMALLLSQLECFYGYSPLEPGREAIVTLQMKSPEQGPAPALRAPDGVSVESPAIRVEGGRQISWRIRALRPLTGNLEFIFPDHAVTKSVDAGSGPRYLSERRVSSNLLLMRYPGESRLSSARVDSIELRYPDRKVHALGLDLSWFVWLVALSMASALILKRRFRVSF